MVLITCPRPCDLVESHRSKIRKSALAKRFLLDVRIDSHNVRTVIKDPHDIPPSRRLGRKQGRHLIKQGGILGRIK